MMRVVVMLMMTMVTNVMLHGVVRNRRFLGRGIGGKRSRAQRASGNNGNQGGQ
jgi:hypothetical protein